jgi:hypothetical protein
MEDALRAAAARAKGLELGITGIVPSDKIDRLQKGSRQGDCEALVDAVFQRVDVKLAVAGRGGKGEATLKLGLVELEGRFYLAELDLNLATAGGAEAHKIVGVMVDFTEKMCGCKDRACANAVDAEYKAWIEQLAARADKTDRPSEEDARRFAGAVKRYAECATKLPP